MTTGRERVRNFVSQLPLLAGLVVLWMLLWGSFTWLNLLTGILLALLVSVIFYLPAVQLSGRMNPWFTFTFLARLLGDIARASTEVALLTLRPRLKLTNAIIQVPLRTRSDLILTWTAVATSIVPGSIVVDIDRVNSTLYLHVLNMKSLEQTDRFREGVMKTEKRIVSAFGSHEDIERMRRLEKYVDHPGRHEMPESEGSI
jgi:multicomponent Na+:H+ antiporter subunit E